MTEEEKFLFDLQGFLVLRGVIEPELLARMNSWLDDRAVEDPKWLGQTGNSHLEFPITWNEDFRSLMDHPVTLPYLKELIGNYLRLDHDYAIFLQPGHTGLQLHGPTRFPYDPIHFYHCRNGQLINGLCVATFTLTDVPPGAGGLAVVPGSHKSNFPIPSDIQWFRRESSIVQQVPTQAGDCVIFTEALIHGTLPWKGPGVRRTLFFKYAPNGIAWENRTYFPHAGLPEMEQLEPLLNERQRRLLIPPSAHDHRQPVE